MTADVALRQAVADDLAVVLALYRQLYPEVDLRSGPRLSQAWQATLAAPDRTVLLAEVGSRPAGTADLTVLANTAHAGQPYLLVENVVVDAAFRRQGVGRALLAAAENRARAAGCYKLQLSAVGDGASAFYQAAGMTANGRTFQRYLGPG